MEGKTEKQRLVFVSLSTKKRKKKISDRGVIEEKRGNGVLSQGRRLADLTRRRKRKNMKERGL